MTEQIFALVGVLIPNTTLMGQNPIAGLACGFQLQYSVVLYHFPVTGGALIDYRIARFEDLKFDAIFGMYSIALGW